MTTYIVIKVKKIERRGHYLQTVFEIPDAVFGPFTDFQAAHSWAQTHTPKTVDCTYYVRRVNNPAAVL